MHDDSVNGADWKVSSGTSGSITEFPYILGRDFSGLVSAVGEEVEDLGVGDAVFGVCDVGQEGAYAEKIAIKASIVARKPDTIPHQDRVRPIEIRERCPDTSILGGDEPDTELSDA